VVQDLQFHANWVQHQLLQLEANLYEDMQKATEQEEGKRVRVSGLPEFITVIDSKAFMLKTLISRILLALKYYRMLLVG